MHAIEYVPDKDTLFGGSNSSLYTIDVVTGAATLIGDTGLTDLAVGMAFDSVNGILYATDGGPRGTTGLFSINLSTGASTLVASFKQPDPFFFQITGLAFDPVLGLFGVDNRNSIPATNRLLKIEPSTGQLTLIGDLNGGNFLGLTFVTAVPEPSTVVLSSIAILAGWGWAWRHRGK